MKPLETSINFIKKLVKGCIINNLFSLANELTYKLTFAFFPFILFLVSLIGFFNLSEQSIVSGLSSALPADIASFVEATVSELTHNPNKGILSLSLIVALFSASSGFNAVIKGINKAYDETEKRNPIYVRALAATLVIIFALSIICSVLVFVFGDSIHETATRRFGLPPGGVLQLVFGLAGYLLVMLFLLFTIIMVYKFGSCKKLTIFEVFPGAAVTLIFWVLSSELFNIYVNNFSRYSTIYGSIGSVIILLLWLNLISIVLLIGVEINALLR